MTSSIKSEVHNVSLCRQRRTEPTQQVTRTLHKKIWKDRTCSSGDMIVDRQTHRHGGRHAHHNTPRSPIGGRVINTGDCCAGNPASNDVYSSQFFISAVFFFSRTGVTHGSHCYEVSIVSYQSFRRLPISIKLLTVTRSAQVSTCGRAAFDCYSASSGRVGYCDTRVCLCVCLCVCVSVSVLRTDNLQK